MKEFTRLLLIEFDKDYEKTKRKKIKTYQALNDMVAYYHKKWVNFLIESETPRQKEICQCFLSHLIDVIKIKTHKLEVFEETGNDKIF